MVAETLAQPRVCVVGAACEISRRLETIWSSVDMCRVVNLVTRAKTTPFSSMQAPVRPVVANRARRDDLDEQGRLLPHLRVL